MPIKIGLDIDNTINNLRDELIKEIEVVYGISTDGNWDYYDFGEAVGLTNKQVFDLFTDELFDRCVLLPNVLRTLYWMMHEYEIEFHIVTSRDKKHMAATYQWLVDQRVPFTVLVFLNQCNCLCYHH